MARAIHQFRYYGNNNNNDNEPQGIDLKNALIKGTLFDGTLGKKYIPILQLGIQTIPGTEFYVNGGLDPIIIGTTGIYELDLKNNIEITQLEFKPKSLDNIDSMPGGYLIIDIIYEDGED